MKQQRSYAKSLRANLLFLCRKGVKWKKSGKKIDKWKENGYDLKRNGKITAITVKEEGYDTIREEIFNFPFFIVGVSVKAETSFIVEKSYLIV